MKKKPITIIVLVCLSVFLIFGIASCTLSRIYFAKNGGFDFNFDFGDATMTDEAEVSLEGVDTIIISTIDADISFTASDSLLTSELYILGNYRAQQIELKSYVDGTTAYIEIVYPVASMHILRSSLTVGLPENFAGQVIIETTSGDITADLSNALTALDVSTVSGDVSLALAEASDIAFTSQSGTMDLHSGIISTLYANTKSGKLGLDISVDSTTQVTLETISGDIKASYSIPCPTAINTTSGDVYIDLPEDSVIQLDYSALDGDYSGAISTSSEGPLYKISSISGDLSFE